MKNTEARTYIGRNMSTESLVEVIKARPEVEFARSYNNHGKTIICIVRDGVETHMTRRDALLWIDPLVSA